MARIHRRTIKKDLNDLDNHDGMITHLEPDILECKVNWALEASLQTKLVELWNSSWAISNPKRCCCESAALYVPANLENSTPGHRTGKGQFSFQSQRKTMQKNVQTTAQLHSSHTLAHQGFPDGSEVKMSASKAGDLGSIPGSGRPPGEGNGNLLQYSCLENPMDRGAW